MEMNTSKLGVYFSMFARQENSLWEAHPWDVALNDSLFCVSSSFSDEVEVWDCHDMKWDKLWRSEGNKVKFHLLNNKHLWLAKKKTLRRWERFYAQPSMKKAFHFEEKKGTEVCVKCYLTGKERIVSHSFCHSFSHLWLSSFRFCCQS